MSMNYLFCWKENRTKKWEMVNHQDLDAYILNLLQNQKVDPHTIFIVPTSSIMGGIWLCPSTHKNSRVDFFHFHKDFGESYVAPKINENNAIIVKEQQFKNGEDSKHGWISPNGKYFHCCYQGHSALADKICFGMVETNNAEHYLEEHGWCKIYSSPYGNHYCVYVGGKHTITKEQMDTLIKMELTNAKGLNEMLCKE